MYSLYLSIRQISVLMFWRPSPRPPPKKKTVVVSKVELATVVEGDQKAPFSIATTRCRGGCYSFLWIAPLYP